MSEPRFRIKVENVVHETIDGELIAIDLGSGSYYSISGSGPAIFEQLLAGASAAEMVAALRARYEVEEAAAEAAVADLLARLRESDLVAVAEDAPPAPAPESGGGEEFVAPVFERYTDMEDYFLLDPIHEVNPGAGWPKPAS